MKRARRADTIAKFALATSALLCVGAVAARRPPVEKADNASPIFHVRLPKAYRDWQLISVAQENGSLNDIRAILGNRTAVEAYRRGTRPFPDGSKIVRLAWRYQSSARNDAVFPTPQSFVAGAPTNVQLSVKNSKRYPTTGGWGYGQFEGGKATADPAVVRTCFACHSKLEPASDYVFTSYSE
jgi:hypothetical protein